MDRKQLSERYKNCLVKYGSSIYSEYATETEMSDLTLLEDELTELGREIYNLGIFSKNEEIDDVNTEDLKFLLHYYLVAEVRRAVCNFRVSRDHAQREKELNSIKALYLDFLNYILSVENALLKEIAELVSSEIGNGDTFDEDNIKRDRNSKIMRFKKTKELKSQLDLFIKSGFCVSDEFESREMYIRLIGLFFLEAIEQVVMTENELRVLSHFSKDSRADTASGSSSKPGCPSVDNLQKPKLSVYNVLPNVKYLTSGCSVDNKNGFSLIDIRERFQSKVFGPSHSLPTISIAEAADIELAQARECERSAENMRKAKEERDQILNDKEYSKEDEENEYKERSWDDWKDLNPKGHGNTIKNIG